MRVLANQVTVGKPFQSKQWDRDSHVFNSQSSDAYPHHTFLPHTALQNSTTKDVPGPPQPFWLFLRGPISNTLPLSSQEDSL